MVYHHDSVDKQRDGNEGAQASGAPAPGINQYLKTKRQRRNWSLKIIRTMGLYRKVSQMHHLISAGEEGTFWHRGGRYIDIPTHKTGKGDLYSYNFRNCKIQ